MKTNNNILYRLTLVLLLAIISACAPLQERAHEGAATVLSKDGSQISYGVKGRGETTIVFVHCWTCDHTFWQPQIEYFADKYRVVWLDLAGHGSSSSARKEYTMQAFGKDVAAVVNKVGGDRVILVGHSMGGPVAIEAAQILGSKVVAIVGVDTFYTPFIYPRSEAEIEDFVQPFKQDFAGASQQMVQSMFTSKVDPGLKESIVKRFSGANPEMGISAMYEIFRWSAKYRDAGLARYSGRLKNINGAPLGNEKELHASVTLIPGVGHFVPQVKPKEFNAALSKIISEYK